MVKNAFLWNKVFCEFHGEYVFWPRIMGGACRLKCSEETLVGFACSSLKWKFQKKMLRDYLPKNGIDIRIHINESLLNCSSFLYFTQTKVGISVIVLLKLRNNEFFPQKHYTEILQRKSSRPHVRSSIEQVGIEQSISDIKML